MFKRDQLIASDLNVRLLDAIISISKLDRGDLSVGINALVGPPIGYTPAALFCCHGELSIDRASMLREGVTVGSLTFEDFHASP